MLTYFSKKHKIEHGEIDVEWI